MVLPVIFAGLVGFAGWVSYRKKIGAPVKIGEIFGPFLPVGPTITMDQRIDNIVRAKLIEREGYRTDVYLDTALKPTVGIGHLVLTADNLKLKDVISKERVEAFYKADTAKAKAAAKVQAAQLKRNSPEFIAALTLVNFQLGTAWHTAKFKGTWAKLMAGDWQGAIANIKVSAWHQQTPKRTGDFIAALQVEYGGGFA